jgi:hypothetical protein
MLIVKPLISSLSNIYQAKTIINLYAGHLQGFSRDSPGFWLKISKIVNQIRCKNGIF